MEICWILIPWILLAWRLTPRFDPDVREEADRPSADPGVSVPSGTASTSGSDAQEPSPSESGCERLPQLSQVPDSSTPPLETSAHLEAPGMGDDRAESVFANLPAVDDAVTWEAGAKGPVQPLDDFRVLLTREYFGTEPPPHADQESPPTVEAPDNASRWDEAYREIERLRRELAVWRREHDILRHELRACQEALRELNEYMRSGQTSEPVLSLVMPPLEVEAPTASNRLPESARAAGDPGRASTSGTVWEAATPVGPEVPKEHPSEETAPVPAPATPLSETASEGPSLEANESPEDSGSPTKEVDTPSTSPAERKTGDEAGPIHPVSRALEGGMPAPDDDDRVDDVAERLAQFRLQKGRWRRLARLSIGTLVPLLLLGALITVIWLSAPRFGDPRGWEFPTWGSASEP